MIYFLSGDLSIGGGLTLDGTAAQVALRLGIRPFGLDTEGRWEGEDVRLSVGLGMELMMCHQVEPPPMADEIGLSITSITDDIPIDGSERRDDIGTYVRLLLESVFGAQVTADPPWTADGVQRVAMRSFAPGSLTVSAGLPFDQVLAVFAERLCVRPFQPLGPGLASTTCLGLEIRVQQAGQDAVLTLVPVGGDLAASPRERLDAADYCRMLLSPDPRLRIV
jgi:hypothetical protein